MCHSLLYSWRNISTTVRLLLKRRKSVRIYVSVTTSKPVMESITYGGSLYSYPPTELLRTKTLAHFTPLTISYYRLLLMFPFVLRNEATGNLMKDLYGLNSYFEMEMGAMNFCNHWKSNNTATWFTELLVWLSEGRSEIMNYVKVSQRRKI